MDCCVIDRQPFEFAPTANLQDLFQEYQKITDFLRSSKLFADASPQLKASIDDYLNGKNMTLEDMNLMAVASAHKLHPLDFQSKVTPDWLMAACLHQQKFVEDPILEKICFEECLKHYVEFFWRCFTTILTDLLFQLCWPTSYGMPTCMTTNDTLRT